jgi:hypothetical protein
LNAGELADELDQALLGAGDGLGLDDVLFEVWGEAHQRQRRSSLRGAAAGQNQMVQSGLAQVDDGSGTAELELDRAVVGAWFVRRGLARVGRVQDGIGDADQAHRLGPFRLAQLASEGDLGAEQA